MLTSDTLVFSRLSSTFRFTIQMLLPLIFASVLGLAAPTQGSTVDTAINDRVLFQQLENATAALAQKDENRLKRDTRLEQCKRPTTGNLHLPAQQNVILLGDEIYGVPRPLPS